MASGNKEKRILLLTFDDEYIRRSKIEPMKKITTTQSLNEWLETIDIQCQALSDDPNNDMLLAKLYETIHSRLGEKVWQGNHRKELMMLPEIARNVYIDKEKRGEQGAFFTNEVDTPYIISFVLKALILIALLIWFNNWIFP